MQGSYLNREMQTIAFIKLQLRFKFETAIPTVIVLNVSLFFFAAMCLLLKIQPNACNFVVYYTNGQYAPE
jgi:hypothetical protein